jgi:hypothetical protein
MANPLSLLRASLTGELGAEFRGARPPFSCSTSSPKRRHVIGLLRLSDNPPNVVRPSL